MNGMSYNQYMKEFNNPHMRELYLKKCMEEIVPWEKKVVTFLKEVDDLLKEMDELLSKEV